MAQASEIQVLVIEDEDAESSLLQRSIRTNNVMNISRASSLGAGMDLLTTQDFDIVLLATALSGADGLDGLLELVECAGTAPVIVLNGRDDDHTAKEALRRGAHDYIVKNFAVYPAIPRIVTYAVERTRIQQRQVRLLREREMVQGILSAMLSVSSECTVCLDDRKRVMLASAAFSKLIGADSKQLVNKPFLDLVDKDNRNDVEVSIDRARTSGRRVTTDAVTLFAADGSEVPIVARIAPTVLENGAHHFVLRIDPEDQQSQPTELDEGSPIDLVDPATHGKEIAASHIEMVGLRKIRDDLGPEWPRCVDTIHTIAETVIRNHLSEADTFEKSGDTDYFIRFDSLTENEASLKARLISAEIRMEVSRIEAPNDRDGNPAPELVAEATELRTRTIATTLDQTDVANGRSLALVLNDKFSRMGVALEHQVDAMLATLESRRDIRFIDTRTKSGRAGRLAIAQFGFDSSVLSEKLREASNYAPEVCAKIDCIFMSHVLAVLAKDLNVNYSIVMVPLSYQTMASEPDRDAFLSLCKMIPAPLRRRLGFLLRDLSEERRAGPIVDAQKALSGYSVIQAIAPSLRQILATNAQTLGARLVVMDFAQLQPMLSRHDERSIDELNNQLADARLCVTNVHSVGDIARIRSLNVMAYTLEHSYLEAGPAQGRDRHPPLPSAA